MSLRSFFGLFLGGRFTQVLLLIYFTTIWSVYQLSFTDKETVGIHELLCTSVMKSDVDVRKDLFENIVLAGGSTLFAGNTSPFVRITLYLI